jgi:23S rRNA pseudouridine1911/1915/1917 synthase
MGRSSEPNRVEILFEDDHMLAAVKPAGLPTANAPAGRPSLFHELKARPGAGRFLGIVSRLDAAVSGVVVVAKTPAAAACLAEQFRERSVDKHYAAIVTGRFPAPLDQWVEWIDWLVRPAGKGPTLVVKDPDSSLDPSVQQAGSRARVVRRAGEVSLVELEPKTGRRHQLRSQLTARGCPIVGDRLYGSRLPYPIPGGIALHATRLVVAHPADGRPLVLEAPLPAAWNERFPQLFSRSAGG